MKIKGKTIKKSAQEMQDDIFRKMTADKKLNLASDFSMFILQLNKLNKNNGFSRTTRENSKDFEKLGEEIKSLEYFI